MADDEIQQLEKRRAMLKSELNQIEIQAEERRVVLRSELSKIMDRIEEIVVEEKRKDQTPLTKESLIEYAESEVLLNPVVKRDVLEDGEWRSIDVANTPAMVLQVFLGTMHCRSYLGYDKQELIETVLDFITDGVDKPINKMTIEETITEIQEILDGAYEIFTIEEFVAEFSSPD